MTRILRKATRLGLLTLLACAAAATLSVPRAAADTTISGTAIGITIPQGNGTFRMVGTYVDPAVPDVTGSYEGTFVEVTTGYTSCVLIGSNSNGCVYETQYNACNLISGQVTFRSQGKSITVPINSDPFLRWTSGVCLDPTDPRIHNVVLVDLVYNGNSPPPGTPPYPDARGYGRFANLEWFLSGTSQPAGSVYHDNFTFQLHLFGFLSS
jgi:hypothetical protein